MQAVAAYEAAESVVSSRGLILSFLLFLFFGLALLMDIKINTVHRPLLGAADGPPNPITTGAAGLAGCSG